MKRLEHMKECLMACVESQMAHLDKVDTKELGEAIDMIKDLEEAIYYCTITKAMNAQEGEMKMMKGHYNGEQYYSDGMMMYNNGGGQRSYYGSNSGTSGNSGSNSTSGGNRQYYADDWNNYGMPYDNEMEGQGRSGRSRRQYMESKKMHKDKTTQMRELEKYMQELSSDIIEMIEEASPEEKQYLSKKIATLATKVEKLE